jgi:uncharacterized protein YabN with tetrapyrrole methylase and pyrophosphatase domain
LGKAKTQEGRSSVLEGVPKSLPALVKASRIQDKVRQLDLIGMNHIKFGIKYKKN